MEVTIEYEPTPKQKLFHATREQGIDQVLFGGAAGGGKSLSLVMDAFSHCMNYPGAKGIILRRTFPELLSSIISKFLEFIPGELYRYSGAEKIAYFINGSQLRFGYLEKESDKYRYQGAEFSYIGIDEMTHISPASFKYMLSRLRNADNIPNYFRGSANPDGMYMEAVKEHFIDEAEPMQIFKDDHEITRQYIPSKLEDNPYLNEDYRRQLEQLPERERMALLEGIWDLMPLEGAFYAKQLISAKEDKRIGSVPIDTNLPVHTVWDLGISDSTAIWLFQLYKDEIRVVGCYANNNVGLDHYINFLHDFRNKFGVVMGSHFAPHDIKVRELTHGKSRLDIARSMGIHFYVVQSKSIVDGIELGRKILSRCYFDEDRCKDGLKALRNYHREFNEKLNTFNNNPVHDWSSHYADAWRYLAIAIPSGNQRLKGTY